MASTATPRPARYRLAGVGCDVSESRTRWLRDKAYMDSTATRESRQSLPALEDAAECALLDGDHEAWIRCCTARFLPVARRVAGDDATAHDALQEIWIAVLHGLSQYRGKPPACAWVGTIVRHEAIRQARTQRRDVPLDFERGPGDSVQRQVPAALNVQVEDEVQARQMVRILLELVNRHVGRRRSRAVENARVRRRRDRAKAAARPLPSPSSSSSSCSESLHMIR